MVSVLNDLRQHLTGLNGAPVAVDANDHQWEITAADLLRALGPEDYEGLWCYPVGVPGSLVYPPASERYPGTVWTRTNWVGASYLLNGKPARHTGDDLDEPGFMDVGENLYAITKGHVTYAAFVPNSTWGNVLVIRYDLPEGGFFYARFGHLNHMLVGVGQDVVPGQKIGEIGNVGMPNTPHCHFDITKPGDDLLAQNALDWPSSRFDDAGAAAFIQQHYIDPGAFVRSHLVPPPPKPVPAGEWLQTTDQTNYRDAAAGNLIAHLHASVRVRVNGSVDAGSHKWGQITECPDQPEAVGYYIARDLLVADTTQATADYYVQLAVLNVRGAAGLSAPQIDTLKLNAKVTLVKAGVWKDGYLWHQYAGGAPRWVAERNAAGDWVGLGPNPT